MCALGRGPGDSVDDREHRPDPAEVAAALPADASVAAGGHLAIGPRTQEADLLVPRERGDRGTLSSGLTTEGRRLLISVRLALLARRSREHRWRTTTEDEPPGREDDQRQRRELTA